MNAYQRLLLPENLNYAWIKVKNLYRTADGYIDASEVAAFELDLERRLQGIRQQFEKGSYRLKKLRPLPRPKKISDEKTIDRQYYHVAIEDQIAWIALVNAIGPDLDQMMEAWSYGNRLYRPAWYETDENSHSQLEIGPYRHASGNLYRKFQHSWPLFRRHITLTARMMVFRRKLHREEMDEADQLAAITAERARLTYFVQDFWSHQATRATKHDLYHASIDLKQFYPKLEMEAVRKGLAVAGGMADPQIANIVTNMLNFQIDMSGMPDTAFQNVDPPFLKTKVKGLPTGLFVAGFLANAAMLPVDRLVAKRLDEQRNIAHFRFVDDHTLIAYDFDALCDWILWYEKLLETQSIGPTINEEKYDPASLGDWLKLLKSGTPIADLREKKSELRSLAMRETRLDGKNPTKLMTKTLAQVSAIAAADIHILDDGDLGERLKMLEWLLLADIPEQEIRPDTRAAFAAGQIASLVPVMIQEADGLVDAARDLAAHQLRRPKNERSTEAERQRYEQELMAFQDALRTCMEQHEKSERDLLSRCFTLLLQSLREHPGKVRLFHRIHQYCRATGHRGLATVSEWLKETRAAGYQSWADYYIALSFQIMAGALLATTRHLLAPDTLRSDVKAAASHLEDIADLDHAVYAVPREREAWYHVAARREFGVALIQVAEMLVGHSEYAALAERLATLSQAYVRVTPGAPADTWLNETGRTSGVWAHLAENFLTGDTHASQAWSALSPYFAFDQRSDLLAARRYPEHLPDAAWAQLLASHEPLPENDSAWLYDVIHGNNRKAEAARATNKAALARAVRALAAPPDDCITIREWTANIHLCNSFDPRRGEWTALEIIAQLLVEATSLGQSEAILDRLHPNNVLLPREWISFSPCHRDRTQLSWEEWRQAVRKGGKFARLRDAPTSLSDYRYALESKSGVPIPDSERRLAAAGRLLVGLLRNDHAAPRIWNLRGNELVVALPRGRWSESLVISSRTTQIIESCLGARSAETRAITRTPSLFGWRDGEQPNDAAFDAPLIYGSTDLLEEIRRAQTILEENQLAVARNQPRQLIPFRLSDFAAGTGSVGAIDEGGEDG